MASDPEIDAVREGFAGRLRHALRSNGYRATEQKVLGDLFGVSGQAVRKWLEGQTLPTAARMPMIAAALGVRTGWLRDGEGPMWRPSLEVRDQPGDAGPEPHEGSPAFGGELAVSGDEVRLLMAYRRLSVEDQAAISRLIFRLRDRPAGGGEGGTDA